MSETPDFSNADTAFMLISASLVMLMTPGLALFYGGMTSKRSVVSMMMQSFLSLCITDLVWWAYGYSLAFGEDQGGVIGSGQKCFLIGVKLTDPAPQNPKIPEMVIFVYQLMFAIITPALISGALGNKMHFKAWFVFQILWITLVYVPWCHWIWGGGWLWQHGIRDFAGGIVVHCTAGFSALGCTLWMQRRRAPQSQSDNSAHKLIESKPHNLPLFALGTGLLWFGWYGFNAGSELAVDQVTVLAFVNTDLAASAAAISWLVVDWVMTGKPKFAGLLVGSVAGLVAITPGSGYVEPWAAVTIGVIVSPVCYAAVRLRQFMEWDDALDVWGCHGVGGYVGKWGLGFFSSVTANAAGEDGLFYGGVSFFFKEIGAASLSAVYAFSVSWVLLCAMSLFMEVTIDDPAHLKNVDRWEFSEVAYGGGGGGGGVSETHGIAQALMTTGRSSEKNGDVELGQKKQ